MTQLIRMIKSTRIRAILYSIIIFSLWGYDAARFIINNPMDVLTNWGTVQFIPALTHLDMIGMVINGRIMYATILICGCILVEFIFRFTSNVKTLYRSLIVIFALLVLVGLVWEKNYPSIVPLFS